MWFIIYEFMMNICSIYHEERWARHAWLKMIENILYLSFQFCLYRFYYVSFPNVPKPIEYSFSDILSIYPTETFCLISTAFVWTCQNETIQTQMYKQNWKDKYDIFSIIFSAMNFTVFSKFCTVLMDSKFRMLQSAIYERKWDRTCIIKAFRRHDYWWSQIKNGF